MILVVGDVHADFDALQAVISHTNAQLILQVGDFGYWPEHSLHRLPSAGFRTMRGELVTVHFCDGNHEDHPALRRLVKTGQTEIAPGIHYQSRGSVIQLLDGRRVLFAGGADSVDKKLRVKGKSWFPGELLKKAEVRKFPDTSVDIIISHAAPACVPLPAMLADGKYADPAREGLELLRLKYQPKLWFFGHYHEAFSVNIDGCSFVGLGRIDAEPDEPCGHGLAKLTAGGFKPYPLHLAALHEGKIFFPTGETALIRCMDNHVAHVREDEIPEPYRTEYFAGAVGSTMCVTEDGIVGVYPHDLRRYLQIRAKGRWLAFGEKDHP